MSQRIWPLPNLSRNRIHFEHFAGFQNAITFSGYIKKKMTAIILTHSFCFLWFLTYSFSITEKKSIYYNVILTDIYF